jgi:hypothetical protein
VQPQIPELSGGLREKIFWPLRLFATWHATPEEVLIRQALLNDAEILFIETDAVPGFNGVAALLRY